MTEVARSSLELFERAVTTLIGEDRSGFGDQDWLEFATGFERLRNQLTAVDHQLVHGIDRSGLAERMMARTTAGVLSRSLRISGREAGGRVRAAEAFTDQTTMTGECVGPRFPALGAVETSGLLGRENRNLALATLTRLVVKHGAPVDVLDRVDGSLAEYVKDLDPDAFGKVCDKIVEVEFPDGLLPNDAQIEKAREVRLKARKDGSYSLAGTLTGECGAKLAAVLDTYARPAPSTAPDGCVVRDPRSSAHRNHDGLQAACEALLRSGTLPDHGGVPTCVIVTIALADLVPTGCRGTGTTADGQHLSPESVGRLLNEAEMLPTVVDARGNVVWQGRVDRFANAADTKYLIARDQGCSFPGCDQPPSHCQRHHIVAYVDGGLTVVTNLTLVCGYHHRGFEKQGWSVALLHGLPAWTPPRWLDPEQKPIIHPRILINAKYLKRLRM